MRTIKSEFTYTDVNGVDWYRCVIVSETKPDTLPTSGADVDGIPDNVGIAAGSVMLTPDGNEIYYSDDAQFEPTVTYTITVTNSANTYFELSRYVVGSGPTLIENVGATTKDFELPSGDYLYIAAGVGQNVTVSGGLSEVDDHIYAIIGDGVITVTGGK